MTELHQDMILFILLNNFTATTPNDNVEINNFEERS